MIDIITVILTFLATLIGAVMVQWLVFLLTRPSTLPPGPLPLPIVGNIFMFFRRDPGIVFKQLHAKYGGAVSIYSGCSSRGLVVIFFDYKTISELANGRHYAETISDRPFSISEQRGVKEGILWAQYDVARHRRRLFMRAFKDFGLGNGKTPSHVGDELAFLHSAVKRNIGQPYQPHNDITEAVTSCILMTVYSQRYDPNDASTGKIIAGGRAFFEGNFFELLLLPYLGIMKHVLPRASVSGERDMELEMTKWLKSEVERRKSTFSRDNITDVLDAYMATDQNGALAFDGFMRSCVDIFLGAMETTSNMLSWSLFFLAHMPDEQDRLFQEIESIVPCSEFPAIEHRPRMVRLDAFILETLRYASLVPFSLTRRCSDTVRFGPGDQYKLEANTSIVFSLYTLNFDADYWLDPNNFRVDRWLDSSKDRLVLHPQSLPFGVGKRVCPGEAVARNLLFIFLGSFIQRFKWRLADFAPFEACRSKLTRIPPDHLLIFTERD